MRPGKKDRLPVLLPTGVISALSYQKRDPRRASVFMDAKFVFGLNVETVEQFRLRKGDEISDLNREEISSFDNIISAKRIASRYTDARRRSEHEVRQKLKTSGFPEEAIIKAIASLTQYGLINDEECARAFLHDKLLTKAASKRELFTSLLKKGIAKPTIEIVLAEISDSESEEERARKAAQKKWTVLLRRESDTHKRKQKLFSFLGTRGFEYQVIKQITSELIGNEEIEDEY